jgi:hypothetical protein
MPGAHPSFGREPLDPPREPGNHGLGKPGPRGPGAAPGIEADPGAPFGRIPHFHPGEDRQLLPRPGTASAPDGDPELDPAPAPPIGLRLPAVEPRVAAVPQDTVPLPARGLKPDISPRNGDRRPFGCLQPPARDLDEISEAERPAFEQHGLGLVAPVGLPDIDDHPPIRNRFGSPEDRVSAPCRDRHRRRSGGEGGQQRQSLGGEYLVKARRMLRPGPPRAPHLQGDHVPRGNAQRGNHAAPLSGSDYSIKRMGM